MTLSRNWAVRLVVAASLWVGWLEAQQWSDSEHVFGTLLDRTITYRPASRLAAEAAATAGGRVGVLPDEAQVVQAQARLACGMITGQIRDAVLALLIQDKGISVTETEVDDEVQARSVEAEFHAAALKQQALNAAMVDGLSRVYDHGENPDSVYESLLATKGYSKATWQSYLAQGKSSSFRQYLSQGAGMAPNPTVDAALRSGLRQEVELRKLDQAIDRDLAANDALFKAYLNEMQASQAAHPDRRSFTMNTDHYRYMKAKRDSWWKARYSEVDLIVRDQQKAAQCDIAALGLRVHSEN